MAVGFVASASSGSQASVASFNIGTLGTGARAGIVFVATHNSSTAVDTGVTWNGVAMTLLYSATDTDTEPGVVRAYFLDNVSNGTITVNRTNNATVCVGYAASISAAGECQAYQTITRVSSTQNTDANTSTTGTGASGEVSVDDGSPGTNSMRFAAAYSGAATPPAAGTNSTNLQVLDSTAFGSRFVRETTAGQGSRSVGFATGTTDDWALVAVAVREKPTHTATGAITHPATTVAGTGTHAENASGTGAVSLTSTTVAGTGAETFTATGAITHPSATVAGSGAEVFTATGAASLAAATVSGSGGETFTATGATTHAATTVAGTGEHTEPVTNASGTGAIGLAATTVAATGSLGLTATGASTLPAATVAGTGSLGLTATGAASLGATSVAGTGLHWENVTGTSAIALSALGVSGVGNISGAGIVVDSPYGSNVGYALQQLALARQSRPRPKPEPEPLIVIVMPSFEDDDEDALSILLNL